MKALSRTQYSGDAPVFQHDKAMHLLQGGFNLSVTGMSAGSVIPRGTVLGVNEATRVATVLKSATITEAATNSATAYKVAKGHLFAVGDFPTLGGAARAITAIDTSNALYDLITVGTTLGVVASVGDSVYGAAGAVASNPVLPITPDGLLYKSVTVVAGEIPLADVVARGTVYARRIPSIPASVRALMPNIIFSESF